MNLTSNNWSLSLDLNGGRIQELTHKGIRVFGTYNRVDGKMGSTHICAPSFDKEGQAEYNLPFHGYARTLMWNVKQQTANMVQIYTRTSATQTYPAELELIQEFQLGNSFIHRVSIRHISGEKVPVNIAIHYYWDTPEGWEESSLNNEPLSANIKTNGYVDLEEQNAIVFPHARYVLKSSGFKSAALWTSYVTTETGNREYNEDFCCVEPVIKWPHFFGSEGSILRSGKTVSASIEIKKVV